MLYATTHNNSIYYVTSKYGLFIRFYHFYVSVCLYSL